MANCRIGVVTVTYNSASVIEGFIRSLLGQTYSDFFTYIVDNASNDRTLALLPLDKSLNLKVIANQSNVGVAAGNNQGILAALADGCEYVLLINNDVEFPANLFVAMEKAIRRHNCEMLVPKIYFHDQPEIIWCAGGHFPTTRPFSTHHDGEGELDNGQHDCARPVSYSPTCCMMIKRSAFDRIGLMDEKYFVYSDDSDFCLRALRAGLVLFYDPVVSMTHKVSSLTGGTDSPFTMRFGTRNRAYFIRKHFPFPISWFWLASYQSYLILRILSRRDSWKSFKVKLNAFREGMRMKVQDVAAT